MIENMRRIAMLSVHTCPMAALGGKETGGMNVYVRELSRELGAQGLLVDIYTRSQDPSRERIRELWPNVRVIHLPAGPERPYSKDLVYEHLPQFVAGLREFSASEGISYDVVHSHYWLSGWVAREFTRDDSLPTAHMFHTLGRMKDTVARNESERETSTRIRVEDELMHGMDRIVAATPLDRAQMIELYAADANKIAVIPLGVDLNLFKPVPRKEAKAAVGIDLAESSRLVLFVGRLDPVKGLDTLLRAMCTLTEIEPELAQHLCLAVIGGDTNDNGADIADELECLDDLKDKVGLHDLVAFLGSRAQDTLPYYYSAAEVCVVPSHYESFGLVALEAMACGTPVIASRVGGLLHTVEDDVTGFLVPAGDPDALADKLRLILCHRSLQERLAVNARRKAQDFTWQEVADRILDLYEDLW
jgi:D-inositol-3-phosphate glycosyltransferase